MAVSGSWVWILQNLLPNSGSDTLSVVAGLLMLAPPFGDHQSMLPAFLPVVAGYDTDTILSCQEDSRKGCKVRRLLVAS